MKVAIKCVSIVTAVALAMSGCATMQGGQGGPRQSALDRSISQCVVTALITTLIGAAVNNRNRGQGARTGLAVGAVACGILLAINNERDKQQIREAQLAALNADTPQTQPFVGQDGQARVVHTSVQEVAMPPLPVTATAPTRPVAANNPTPSTGLTTAPSPDTFVGPCRNAQSAISTAQGQTVQLSPDLYCRTAGGDWKPYGAA